ncbi:hypothetical protein ACQ7CX_09825 [Chryseobacterium arthrosphaerae]|uniref:hypothetical protein n=1 Tax=Chryseobacterium arthrosphaerae TaxID=651561 RepID=UPI001BAE6620|nr:hypothetical protein [Chryseobacterium arthrosphaerae]QUY53740.1 hypothetical protein I2F65_12680 [Chryseobacterium arthrosphaerae]
MKSFEEIKKTEPLTRFLGSKSGTMYFNDNVSNGNDIIIRHLDGELTPELLPVYVQLYEAVLEYIDTHHRIKEHVFIPQLLEVGEDYIIRPFYVYLVPIRKYFSPDEPLEPLKEYYEMIRAFSEEMIDQFWEEDITDPNKQSIVKRILRKSLMQPTGKTFFEGRHLNKYIIVEPAISIEDLEKWKMIDEEYFLKDK